MDSDLSKINLASNSSNTSGSANSGFSLAEGAQAISDSGPATMSLGIFGGLFRGMGGIFRGLGGGLIRGVGAIGRGIGGIGRGIFNGGRALVGGAGRLLGGAAQGLGGLLGNAGGGLIGLIQSLFSGGGG